MFNSHHILKDMLLPSIRLQLNLVVDSYCKKLDLPLSLPLISNHPSLSRSLASLKTAIVIHPWTMSQCCMQEIDLTAILYLNFMKILSHFCGPRKKETIYCFQTSHLKSLGSFHETKLSVFIETFCVASSLVKAFSIKERNSSSF